MRSIRVRIIMYTYTCVRDYIMEVYNISNCVRYRLAATVILFQHERMDERHLYFYFFPFRTPPRRPPYGRRALTRRTSALQLSVSHSHTHIYSIKHKHTSTLSRAHTRTEKYTHTHRYPRIRYDIMYDNC